MIIVVWPDGLLAEYVVQWDWVKYALKLTMCMVLRKNAHSVGSDEPPHQENTAPSLKAIASPHSFVTIPFSDKLLSSIPDRQSLVSFWIWCVRLNADLVRYLVS